MAKEARWSFPAATLCLIVVLIAHSWAELGFAQEPFDGGERPTTFERLPSGKVEPAGFEWPSTKAEPDPGMVKSTSSQASAHLPQISKPNEKKTSKGDTAPSRSAGRSLWSTIVPTALIIGLILLASWIIRKNGPAVPGGIPHDAMEILGKRHLDQRQQIYLVRCGTRILVIGSSAGGMNTLAEVTDPVEIDFLAGLCRKSDSASSLTKSFGQLFTQHAGWGTESTSSTERSQFEQAASVEPHSAGSDADEIAQHYRQMNS